MRMSCATMISLLTLGGCAIEPTTGERLTDASDPACSAAAAARARDAAVNGYDEEAQRSIWQESYKSCVAWNRKSILVESAGH